MKTDIFLYAVAQPTIQSISHSCELYSNTCDLCLHHMFGVKFKKNKLFKKHYDASSEKTHTQYCHQRCSTGHKLISGASRGVYEEIYRFEWKKYTKWSIYSIYVNLKVLINTAVK